MTKEKVSTIVEKRINYLTQDLGQSQQALAHLYREVENPPGRNPFVWEYTLKGVPKGNGEDPSYEEWAVHITLTLFAWHQRQKNKVMHAQGKSLGKAVRKLKMVSDSKAEPLIKAHFDTVLMSDGPEIAHNLKGLLHYLREKDIPLDYSLLAGEIYEFLSDTDLRNDIRLNWSLDYHS